jgi:hypothetical protein
MIRSGHLVAVVWDLIARGSEAPAEVNAFLDIDVGAAGHAL